MAQSVALLRSERSSFHHRRLFPRLLTLLRLIFHPKTSLEGVDTPFCATDIPNQSKSFSPGIDQSIPIDPGAVGEHLVDLVPHLRSRLPDSCEWLEHGALEFVGEHPVDAGGTADVWVGKVEKRKVAIKVYRCDSSSNYLVTYMRFYKEALACSRVKGGSFVPLIGLYSTPRHPLALVFEFMDHLNLREYLRNNGDGERCELLLEIARGVEHMHKLNIVHGNLKTTNILVDSCGRARVAGLGTALLPSADGFFHGTAPELVDPPRFGLTDAGTTKASDVYAFGVLAWEIFAGRVPFSDEGGVAGVCAMLGGRRPPRPDHPGLSNCVWKMIKGCWECDPARRGTVAAAVIILDAEINAR